MSRVMVPLGVPDGSLHWGIPIIWLVSLGNPVPHPSLSLCVVAPLWLDPVCLSRLICVPLQGIRNGMHLALVVFSHLILGFSIDVAGAVSCTLLRFTYKVDSTTVSVPQFALPGTN
jgi:hypothetical protein